MQPTIGTGLILYTQVGFLLPKLKNGQAFMPYITHTLKDFDRIGKFSNQMDVGLNYFISGHNAKITAQYSLRPTYKYNSVGDPLFNGYKGSLLLDTYFLINHYSYQKSNYVRYKKNILILYH